MQDVTGNDGGNVQDFYEIKSFHPELFVGKLPPFNTCETPPDE
jgi:hypothetical protein